MDQESMENLLSQLPLLIRMKDGRQYVVKSDREILNGPLDSYVLSRSSKDNKLRGIHLRYVTMSGVEPNDQQQSA